MGCCHGLLQLFDGVSMKYWVVIVLLSVIYVVVQGTEQQQQKCVKWGNTFDVPLNSKNVALECQKPDGRRVCCAAVEPYGTYHSLNSRGVGIDYSLRAANKNSAASSDDSVTCEITKTYVSSPLELKDLALARSIENITDPDQKFDALLTYVTSDELMESSTRWLNRVSIHMKSPSIPPETRDDRDFLSYFLITRTCSSGKGANAVVADRASWKEWIEPITIHARHPFGFGRCRNVQKYTWKKRAGRSDTDYVLLQSGQAIHNQSYSRTSSFGKSSRREIMSRRHFLLDAGTSTFDSSLFWFTCGYSQREISFDQVMAWEMTLLEPTEYWSRVPPNWKPYWHFFNVPISSDPSHPDSPIRYLKNIATADDFVSFKLDIDHPDTEMPIALSLLSDPGFAELVDEFFFELHFRCDVMTSCGWGKRVPFESHGLVLNRPTVLEFFLKLRQLGIRAHIWP